MSRVADPTTYGEVVERSPQDARKVVPANKKGDQVDESDAPAKVTRACEPCRKKKIKCDSNAICGNCIAYKTECYTTDRSSKRRKPKNEKYVAELEQRIEALQQMLEESHLKDKEQHTNHTQRPDSREGSPLILPCGHAVGPVGWKCEQCGTVRGEATPTDVDALAETMGYLFLHQNGESEYMGASAAGTVIDETKRQIKQIIGNDSFDVLCAQALRAYAINLRKADAALIKLLSRCDPARPTLPTRDVCAKYVAAYFQQVHHVFPLLDKEVFFAKADMAHNTTLPFDTSFNCIYFLVLAFGAHIIHGEAVGEAKSVGYQYFAAGTSLVYAFIHDVSIQTVHAMMLLALYMENALQFSCLWHIFGTVVRKAQTLGLHRDLPVRFATPGDTKPPELAHQEMETRRRTYWMIYIMDNKLTIANGKPCALQDFDCDQAIPLSSNDSLQDSVCLKFQDGTPFSFLHAQIQLARISHQIQQRLFSIRAFTLPREQLNTILADLDNKLLSWLQNMPDVFSPDRNGSAYTRRSTLPAIYHTHLIPLLQLHYHNMMITIHRRNLGTWAIRSATVQTSAASSGPRFRTQASHAIALHAARASLAVLASSPPRTGDVSVQLKVTYPTLAAFILFANVIHNSGSGSAYEDIETIKRLIRTQEPEKRTGDGNLELQQEFFTEIVRVAVIAMNKSNAQGTKRSRPAALSLQPHAYADTQSHVSSVSSSEQSYGQSFTHALNTNTMPSSTKGDWQSPTTTYQPMTDLAATNGYTMSISPESHGLPIGGRYVYDNSPTYIEISAIPHTVRSVPLVGYNNAFDESLWQMSTLANAYEEGL